MSETELRARFPKASEAFIRANALPDCTALPPGVYEPSWPANSASPPPPAKAPQIKGKPRLRQRQGDGMNKTERDFSLHLPTLVRGTIRFNAVSFELANGLRFKPDFTVDLRLAYEAKGPWASRDAFPRLKMAARLFPEIKWFLATRAKGGGWDILEVLP